MIFYVYRKDSFFDCISEQQNLLKYIDVYMMLQHIHLYQNSNDFIFWYLSESHFIRLLLKNFADNTGQLYSNLEQFAWHLQHSHSKTIFLWVHIRSTKYFWSGQLLFPTVWLVVSIVQSQQIRWFEVELGFHQVRIYLQGMILQNSLIIM